MRLPSLLPREDKFFELLRNAALNMQDTSHRLVRMLEDYTSVEYRAKGIALSEAIGDQITHEIMRQLHRTFVTPIDREDIIALADRIDDIVDHMEVAARYMAAYRIEAPTSQALALARILERGAPVLVDAVGKLRSRGRALREILPLTVEINRLENEADQVVSQAVADLFTQEKSEVMVIKWRDVYSQLEMATDRMEDAANVLEGIVLKNG